jgi:hypothetical protein
MNYQQKTLIVNTYFKYAAIYLVLAIILPLFFNLNSESESSFISWMKFLFVLFIFLSITMFINGIILRGVVS